jgi:hypothetical protein
MNSVSEEVLICCISSGTLSAAERLGVQPPRRAADRPLQRPVGLELRAAYWVAQVCNADARDHLRVAQDGWRANEMVEESNAGTKEKRYDVNVDFVE